MTARTTGRPNGRIIHSPAFEAIRAARGFMKKDVAAEAGVTPGYLGDLLAHRCGASPKNAEAISRALGVQIEVLFPEACGWVSPLPDRTNKLEETAA